MVPDPIGNVLEAALLWFRESPGLVWGLAAASVVTFVGTLIAVPVLLSWIPDDYFLHPPRDQEQGWTARHPALRLAGKAAKNLLGAAFVLCGLAMLVLPGQGLLTMFAGLVLMDVPGKRRLEVALLRRRHVRAAVDWLRRRRGRPPLRLPPKRSCDSRAAPR